MAGDGAKFSASQHIRPSEGVVELISSSCWHIHGEVEGIDTEFLVDTGSTYTILDIGFYKDMESQNSKPLEEVNLSLRSASGNLLKVYGQTVVNITMGNRSFETLVKVVDLGDRTTILGLDFMTTYNCILNMGQGFMKIGHKVRLEQKNGAKCTYIKVAKEFCVPPNHEMIVQGTFDQGYWNTNCEIGFVEPIEPVTTRTGLLIAKGVVNTRVSDIPVRVANFTDDQLFMNKGSKLALLQPVTSLKKFKTDNLQSRVLAKFDLDDFENKGELPEHLKPLIESVSEKLKESEVLRFERLLHEYQDIFVGPDGKLGLTNLIEHSIDTGNHLPIKQRSRRLPIAQREAVEKELNKLEKQGLIEPSDSPWAAPLVIVTKKDGSLRVCTDFRAINNISRKSAVVLPNTNDCLASLDGAK